MSYVVPKQIPNRCGRCPCFHAEHPMYCQAVKADKNKKIYAPYGEDRPDWCPLIEVKEPHGDLTDKDKLMQEFMDSDLDYLPRDDWKEIIQIVSGADVVIKAERNEE